MKIKKTSKQNKLILWLKNNWKTKLILLLVLVIASFLRLYKLDTNPPALFCDETSIFLNAEAILNHGTDEHGKPFPVFFQAFNDYKNPLQIYLSVPFVFLGHNEWAVRLPSAIFGILGVFFIYLLANKLFGRTVGLLAAFVLAVMPWHIHMSRIAFEGLSLMPTMITLAVFLSIKAKDNVKYIYISAIVWGLSFYSYSVARIVVPFLLILLSTINFKQVLKYWKHYLVCLVIIGAMLFPFFDQYFNHPVKEWGDKMITAGNLSLTQITSKALGFYADHFKPEFLLNGNAIDRHGTREFGQIFPIMYFLAGIGIIASFFKFKKGVIPLSLLLAYPLGGTFTNGPIPTRDSIGTVAIALLAAMGVGLIIKLLKLIKWRSLGYYFGFVIIIGALIILSYDSGRFFRTYQYKYPFYSANSYYGWSYGAKEAINYFLTVKNNYDQMIITSDGVNGPINRVESIISFYSFYDPKIISGQYDKLDPNKRQLLALKPQLSLSNAKIVKAIYNPSGELVLNIWESTPNTKYIPIEKTKPSN